MKLDILAFGAHPDDVEISCSGTLLKHISMGKTAGVVDLTRGELGTRGTPEGRLEEAAASAKILGLSVRENLGMRDGFFKNDEEHQLKVIAMIRKYRPDVVFCNSLHDRHTDHGRAGQLVQDASYLSGLKMIETLDNNSLQEPWRPKIVLRYIQDQFIVPDIVVDITGFMEGKIASIKAFKTQFYDESSTEPQTPISVPYFFDMMYGRAMDMGRYAGVQHAEGFNCMRPAGVRDVTELF
ncbi:MAG TPA: bacillithiol biosynthesis deacetylase BshB1 [Bacteroidia bacterium]|nr:bacillithiol biosynthesis deacetylase BshB1 [Bacteroidia bacterium]